MLDCDYKVIKHGRWYDMEKDRWLNALIANLDLIIKLD